MAAARSVSAVPSFIATASSSSGSASPFPPARPSPPRPRGAVDPAARPSPSSAVSAAGSRPTANGSPTPPSAPARAALPGLPPVSSATVEPSALMLARIRSRSAAVDSRARPASLRAPAALPQGSALLAAAKAARASASRGFKIADTSAGACGWCKSTACRTVPRASATRASVIALMLSALTTPPLLPVVTIAVMRSSVGRQVTASFMRSSAGASSGLLSLSLIERSTRRLPSALMSDTATSAVPARFAMAWRIAASPRRSPSALGSSTLNSRLSSDVDSVALASNAFSLPLPLVRSRSFSLSFLKGMPC
mmetsp:Transcript_6270/g.25173  ORF Transcript_6270/g.25173 Transcript_6270/m.25173 type:complete len:310 (-) Transcript_6270:6319-7248(-)